MQSASQLVVILLSILGRRDIVIVLYRDIVVVLGRGVRIVLGRDICIVLGRGVIASRLEGSVEIEL